MNIDDLPIEAQVNIAGEDIYVRAQQHESVTKAAPILKECLCGHPEFVPLFSHLCGTLHMTATRNCAGRPTPKPVAPGKCQKSGHSSLSSNRPGKNQGFTATRTSVSASTRASPPSISETNTNCTAGTSATTSPASGGGSKPTLDTSTFNKSTDFVTTTVDFAKQSHSTTETGRYTFIPGGHKDYEPTSRPAGITPNATSPVVVTSTAPPVTPTATNSPADDRETITKSPTGPKDSGRETRTDKTPSVSSFASGVPNDHHSIITITTRSSVSDSFIELPTDPHSTSKTDIVSHSDKAPTGIHTTTGGESAVSSTSQSKDQSHTTTTLRKPLSSQTRNGSTQISHGITATQPRPSGALSSSGNTGTTTSTKETARPFIPWTERSTQMSQN